MCSLAASVSCSLAFSRLPLPPMIRVLRPLSPLLLIVAARDAAETYIWRECWRTVVVMLMMFLTVLVL